MFPQALTGRWSGRRVSRLNCEDLDKPGVLAYVNR